MKRKKHSPAFWAGMTAMLALMIGSSCMMSPQHEQRIASNTEPLYFGGYWSAPNEWIYLQAYSNRDGRWDAFNTAGSGSTQATDAQGGAWYIWETTTRIPTDAKYWWAIGEDGDREMRINVRAQSVSTGIPLTTFQVGAENCQAAAAQAGLSGLETMGSCGTTTAEAYVYVACGDSGEAACTADNVAADEVCNGSLINRDGVCRRQSTPIPRPPTGGIGTGNTCDTSKVGTACSFNTSNMCSTGVTAVAGEYQCVNNKLQCQQTQKYCKFGDTRPETERCGASVGQTCQYDEQCVPGAVCDQSMGVCASWDRSIQRDICTNGKKQNYCWLPWTNDNNKPAGSRNQDACL
jgi:hypothetical protein